LYAVAFKSQDNKQLDLSVVHDAGYALILPWMPVPVSMITLTQVVSGTSTVVARAAIGREIPDLKHLALTINGTQAKVYFRGRLLMTGTLSTPMTIDRVELQGGTKDTLLSEMLLMPRVAKPEDIKTWWNLQAPFYDPSPVVYKDQIPYAGDWDSKNKTYYQDTPPTGTLSLGDVWFDTSNHNRRHWWDGSKWVDAEDVSPIDASQRPVTARGLGGVIEMDHEGMRFIRKADNKITLQMDIETGSAFFRGDITGASGTFADGRVAIGDIGGKPWGDGALPAGTAGIWGDQAGLYLRGYARLLTAGSAFDEDVIDLSDFPNVNQPEILVAPKELVTINPPEGATSNLYVDAIKLPDGNFRVKAKAIVKGESISWGGRSETADSWSFVRPTTSVDGKKGVFTDFFICRPAWRVASGGLGLYTARLWMDITDQFNANGDPINWQTIRTFSRSSAGSGTLNWDTALPHYGQWALRVRGEGGGAVLIKYAFTALQESGYRTGDNYYDVDGELIEAADPANQPSRMSVIYFVFDRG
jgi:hypothetical protein